MYIYFVALGLSLIFAYFFKNSNYKVIIKFGKYKFFLGKIILAFLVFFPLTFISAFRYDVGVDYLFTYVPVFQSTIYWKEFPERISTYNKLWYYFIIFLSYFSTNYIIFFIVTSVIINFFTYSSILKNSVNIYYSILLLILTRYYFFSLNQIRQFIVISAFLYSIKFITNREFKKYFLLMISMIFVHTSALIYLPMYFVGKMKLKMNHYIFLILSIVIFFQPISNFLTFISEKIYFMGYFGRVFNNHNVSAANLFVNIPIFIATIYCLGNYRVYSNYKFVTLANLHLIATILSIFSYYIPNSERIIRMFTATQILFIPELYKFTKHEIKSKLFHITFCIGLFVLMLYLVVYLHHDKVYPYQFIW